MNLRTAKIISLSLTVLGVFVALQGATFSWFNNHQGYAPAQPINSRIAFTRATTRFRASTAIHRRSGRKSRAFRRLRPA